MTATVLFPGDDLLGEAPAWVASLGLVVRVDLPRGVLHGGAPGETMTEILRVDGTLSAALPRRVGGYALCTRDRIRLVAADGADDGAIELDLADGMRLSDACATPAGDLLVGEVDDRAEVGEGRLGRVLRLRAGSREVDTLIEGVGFANGIRLSPSGERLHLVDSAAATVTTYAYADDDAPPSAETAFALDGVAGTPDGLAVDRLGCLWIAMFGGSALRVHRPGEAEPERVLRTPVSRVSSCAFVGPDLSTLAVTTARVGMSDDDVVAEPLAGSVLAMEPGVRGAQVPECAL